MRKSTRIAARAALAASVAPAGSTIAEQLATIAAPASDEAPAVSPAKPAKRVKPRPAAITPASETPAPSAPENETPAPASDEPAISAKPDNAAPETQAAAPASTDAATDTAIDMQAARRAAAAAAQAFYNGASLPFKSVATAKALSDYNPTNGKKPSARTGALVAMLLAYSTDTTFAATGEFTRGAFVAIDPQTGKQYNAMPESGALGNIAGRVISHVSGPLGGKNASTGVFKLNFEAARIELQQIGDAAAKPALIILDKLCPPAPAKQAA